MRDRNKAVPASYLILQQGNKILLMRRQGSGYYDGWYSVPAGHVEEGELLTDCLIRETKEELGIDLDKKDIRLVHTMYRTKHDETGDRADYFFLVTKWHGEPRICEPRKCDDIRWFSREALPENMMHHVREAVECVGKGVSYSELGRDRIPQNPSRQPPTHMPQPAHRKAPRKSPKLTNNPGY